jgi:Pyruvate/2-oxoacid:ferredoxin oxidoreductase delta subunit
MENAREVSRKEFLKFIPKYVIQNVRALIQGRLNFSDDGEAETREDILSDNKAAKVVQLEAEHCLAWDGGNCQFCYLACPLRDKAITLDDQRPTVNISFCDGCGQCVTACQTVNDRPALKIVFSSIPRG